jgi:hypothetical protein
MCSVCTLCQSMNTKILLPIAKRVQEYYIMICMCVCVCVEYGNVGNTEPMYKPTVQLTSFK